MIKNLTSGSFLLRVAYAIFTFAVRCLSRGVEKNKAQIKANTDSVCALMNQNVALHSENERAERVQKRLEELLA